MVYSALVLFIIMIFFVLHLLKKVSNDFFCSKRNVKSNVSTQKIAAVVCSNSKIKSDTACGIQADLLDELKGIAFSRAKAELNPDLEKKIIQIVLCDQRLLAISSSIKNNNLSLVKNEG
ncbi:hypothetical protein [Shewanella surugensis]|uniref:Uncharacterized protein n=1 Tax=Shewanella surugensis TaxID=212020 RepID=A0ABT0L9H7_9GAMM|nr:hypothetical protein [Shewanella surugensis]MCL1124209.1 hypothetical protein [Shewanella surugensis]